MQRGFVALFFAATALGACRKPTPDEIVYSGRSLVPPPPPLTGVGAGGATGSMASTVTGSTVATATGMGPGGGGGATSTTDDAGSGAGGEAGSGAGGSSSMPATFTKAAFLGAVADCALGRYRAFEHLALELRDKSRAYATTRSDANAAAARAAWLAANASWQEAELFRIGPMARPPDPGAEDVRDQVYGWPLFNRCRTDEQIVNQAYARADFATSLINGRGLGAYEYLAFYGGADNGCTSFSALNSQGTWAALGASELGRRKADYAAAIADDIVLRATSLVQKWDPAFGNFRKELAEASSSTVFGSERRALNAVSDALFYVEQEVKDWKLGRPSGLIDCMSGTCPGDIESPYARVSTQNIKSNLVGFRRVFEGCGDSGAGIGFDDWLRAVGAGDLADRMLAAYAGAVAAVDGLDPPLEQAIATDPNKVRAVFYATKALTDLVKTEFVTVLNLELPPTSIGDND